MEKLKLMKKEYERYKEPDEERYKRDGQAGEDYVNADGGHLAEEEGRVRQKQPERIPDWDRRPNVNRRKVKLTSLSISAIAP